MGSPSIKITAFLAFTLCCLAAGPLGAFLSSYGNLLPNREVTKMFEAFQVLDGYRYYISGPEEMPRGIIGVKKGYAVQSDLWREVNLEREGLERYVRGVRSNVTEMSNFPYGMEIVGPDGALIGYWYSDVGATVVRVKGDNEVEIYPPSGAGGGTGGGPGGSSGG